MAGLAALAPAEPFWNLHVEPDGSVSVLVRTVPGSDVLVLRRGKGVSVFRLSAEGPAPGRWRGRIPVADGEALDLYVLPRAVPHPERLPAQGPLDGFRERIYPVHKKG